MKKNKEVRERGANFNDMPQDAFHVNSPPILRNLKQVWKSFKVLY